MERPGGHEGGAGGALEARPCEPHAPGAGAARPAAGDLAAWRSDTGHVATRGFATGVFATGPSNSHAPDSQASSLFADLESPVDDELFETLRTLRRSLAGKRDVPAYVIFSDVSLREMAGTYPTDPEAFRRVRGVGERRFADLGPAFMQAIREHVTARGAKSGAPPAGALL